MSTSLYWKPVIENDRYLGSDLKWALRARLDESRVDETEIGRDWLPWLRGVMDGGGQGCDEAKKLIALVEKHGSVIVWEQS